VFFGARHRTHAASCRLSFAHHLPSFVSFSFLLDASNGSVSLRVNYARKRECERERERERERQACSPTTRRPFCLVESFFSFFVDRATRLGDPERNETSTLFLHPSFCQSWTADGPDGPHGRCAGAIALTRGGEAATSRRPAMVGDLVRAETSAWPTAPAVCATVSQRTFPCDPQVALATWNSLVRRQLPASRPIALRCPRRDASGLCLVLVFLVSVTRE